MFDKFDIEINKEEFFKNPVEVLALMMFDCKYGTTFSLDIEPNKIYKTWHETDFVYEKAEKVFYRLGRAYITELDLVYPPRKYIYLAKALLKGNIKRAKILSKSFDVYSNLINFLNSFIILEKIKDTPIPVPKYLELIRGDK